MSTPETGLGLPKLDSLNAIESPTLQQYIQAVSEYILRAGSMSQEAKKAAQIRLSGVLGCCLARSLERSSPPVTGVHVGEREVSGALRIVQADVSLIHHLDGLRLAIEIKPVNLAVGRAIWNRFGDIRTFAVNLHLKFPFAVIGGVLTIPTVEFVRGQPKSTVQLIERAVTRLIRAGGRRNEADAAHLLEAVAVVVYDPTKAELSQDLPMPGTGLRWEEFVQTIAEAYDARFED